MHLQKSNRVAKSCLISFGEEKTNLKYLNIKDMARFIGVLDQHHQEYVLFSLNLSNDGAFKEEMALKKERTAQ